MTLAERISEAQGEMSDADLARATHNTAAAVTQWKNGKTLSLKGETVALMEQATGYRASWIVLGKGPKRMGEAAPVSHIPASSVAQALRVLSAAIAASPKHGTMALTGALADWGKDPENPGHIETLEQMLTPAAGTANAKAA